MPTPTALEKLGYAQLRPGLYFGPRPPTGPVLALSGVIVRRACLYDDLAYTPPSMYEQAESLASYIAYDLLQRGPLASAVVTCSEGRNRSALVASLV